MVIDKKWFKEKILAFLSEDENNKMSKIDGIFIFDPDSSDSTNPFFLSFNL